MYYEKQRELLLKYKKAYDNFLPQRMIKVMKEWKRLYPYQSFRETYAKEILKQDSDRIPSSSSP